MLINPDIEALVTMAGFRAVKIWKLLFYTFSAIGVRDIDYSGRALKKYREAII